MEKFKAESQSKHLLVLSLFMLVALYSFYAT